MIKTIFNHKAKKFFRDLIDEKTALTNELFRAALKFQEEAMNEIAENNNDDIERVVEIVEDYILSSDDLSEYIQYLNEEESLIFASNFDLIQAQNDRSDMCFDIVVRFKESAYERSKDDYYF